MPASLGLTSDIKGHVATEHDVWAWEAWLTLRWLISTPGGTLAHRLNCQPGLTLKLNILKPIYYVLFISFIHRSGGPRKNGPAYTCVYTFTQLIISNYSTKLVAQPANTGLWRPAQIYLVTYITRVNRNYKLSLIHI